MSSHKYSGLGYVREGKYYNQHSLAQSLRLSIETAGELLRKLVRDGAADSRVRGGEEFISLQFVGLIVFENLPFLVLPKTVKGPVALDERVRYLRLVTKSVARYALDFPRANLADLRDFVSKEDSNRINRFGLAIKLLEHWADHGLHYRPSFEYEIDGQGETDWSRTIDREIPFRSSNGQTAFLTLHTRRTLEDESHLVRRLHRAILADCGDYLLGLGLLDFFVPAVPMKASDLLCDLVASHDLDSALHHELSTVYSESAEERVRLMMAYLHLYSGFEETERITYLGTKSFHRIWETATAWSLANQLSFEREAKAKVSDITFHASEVFEYSIEQLPHWAFADDATSLGSPGEPDILLSGQNLNSDDDTKYFWIVDAKYYDVSGSFRVEKFPGVNDVLKQHMYQLAFERRITSSESFSRKNIFLFPGADFGVDVIGTVRVPFLLASSLTEIDLVSVCLPKVLECYVHGVSGSLRQELLDAF
jgi:hypothetical protein